MPSLLKYESNETGRCLQGRTIFLNGSWFLGQEFFWVTPSSTSTVTPSKAQGGLKLSACCLQLQVHPGVYTQATFAFLQLSHDYKQTCSFQTFFCLIHGSVFIHSTNASSVPLLKDRQISLPPALSNEFLSKKKKKILSQLFFSLILSKGYRSFWSTSKCCWQGHNWTFFPLQYKHY